MTELCPRQILVSICICTGIVLFQIILHFDSILKHQEGERLYDFGTYIRTHINTCRVEANVSDVLESTFGALLSSVCNKTKLAKYFWDTIKFIAVTAFFPPLLPSPLWPPPLFLFCCLLRLLLNSLYFSIQFFPRFFSKYRTYCTPFCGPNDHYDIVRM